VTTIERYEITGDPISGGMATIYPCKDSVLDRSAVMKIMPPGADQRRVMDEVNALLKMRSKHVVQVYDIFLMDNRQIAIVQEFIDGRDLFDKSLRPKSALKYLKLVWQIASGIADMHAINVIHRDIKPNNMKVDPEGILKIFDFGLARDEGPKAATVGFVGTHGYAAPELYLQNVQFTPAVDTYAFGATALYLGLQSLPEPLLKRPPEVSETNYFHSLSFALNDEIAQTLNACIAQDPSERPCMQTVRDVLAKHLLHDRHRALAVFQGKAVSLDSGRRSVSLKLANMGEIDIH
jgi:serine/threonine protein kinase